MFDISCESSAWQSRGFTRNIKPYFLQKMKIKLMKVSSAAILLGALRVNTGVPKAFNMEYGNY